MHKLILTIVAFALIGCAQPTQSHDSGKLIVVNSLWHVVKTVDRSASRELVTSDLNAEVEAYNAETLDDFLRVYVDTVPDLSEAPPVDVYIVNPGTYEILMAQEGIPRESLIENEVGWRQDSYGRLLFIDHVPPPPVFVPPPSMYAWYALYAIDENGAIVYEDHCGYNADESFTGQWITIPEAQGGGGWASVDAYFATIKWAFQHDVNAHPGWTFIEHQLYEAPQ